MKAKLSPSLQKLFTFWVETLRLQDWELSVSLGTSEQGFDDPGICAKVAFTAEMKSAEIFLRRLDKPDQALEEDLVHELLHLVFIQASHSLIGKSDTEQLPLEQAINTTADALARMRRGTKRASWRER